MSTATGGKFGGRRRRGLSATPPDTPTSTPTDPPSDTAHVNAHASSHQSRGPVEGDGKRHGLSSSAVEGLTGQEVKGRRRCASCGEWTTVYRCDLCQKQESDARLADDLAMIEMERAYQEATGRSPHGHREHDAFRTWACERFFLGGFPGIGTPGKLARWYAAGRARREALNESS